MGSEHPQAKSVCPSGATDDDSSTGQNQGKTEEHFKGISKIL